MLGLGINMPKTINIINSYKGPLDELGLVSNCVFTFSPYRRLTGAYKDELIKVNNIDTFESKYFGPNKDGNIESSEVMNWLSGSVGVVSWVANEKKTSNPSYQNTLDYCPRISDGTNFQANGLMFDGSDDKFEIVKYSDINFRNPPFCIYTNRTGFNMVFNINTNGYNETQYGLRPGTPTSAYFYVGTGSAPIIGATHNMADGKDMWTVFNNGVNGMSIKSQTGETFGTASDKFPLPERNYVRIGCRMIGGVSEVHLTNNLKTIVIWSTDERTQLTNIINNGL